MTSTDTLVSLSREGEGSSAPLVTALTAAVLEAAKRVAAASPGGRLPVELIGVLGVLDEAANVCRWRELPRPQPQPHALDAAPARGAHAGESTMSRLCKW